MIWWNKINCIIPTNRPEFIARAIAAVRCQTVPTCVIVVENGAARGACALQSLRADVVLQSHKQGAPSARNVGLRYVQDIGRGHVSFVSFFDDDDLYYPQHLQTLMDVWRPGTVAGRMAHYLRTREGRLLLLAHQPGGRYVMVQSMLCRADDVGEWDESLPVEEVDVAWCQGKQLRAASPLHFAFNNGPWPHLWAPDDIEWPVRCPAVYDLGPYDAAVVNGTAQPVQRVLIPPTIEAFEHLRATRARRIADGTY